MTCVFRRLNTITINKPESIGFSSWTILALVVFVYKVVMAKAKEKEKLALHLISWHSLYLTEVSLGVFLISVGYLSGRSLYLWISLSILFVFISVVY